MRWQLGLGKFLIFAQHSVLFKTYLSVFWLSAGFFGCGVPTCRCCSHSGWRCSLKSTGRHFRSSFLKKWNGSPNKLLINGRRTRSINRVQRAESRLLPANSGAVHWWRMWEVTSVSSPNFTPLLNLAPQFYLKSRACTRAARVRVSWVSYARPMGTRDMGPGAAGSCVMALPLATCRDAGRLFFLTQKVTLQLKCKKNCFSHSQTSGSQCPFR